MTNFGATAGPCRREGEIVFVYKKQTQFEMKILIRNRNLPFAKLFLHFDIVYVKLKDRVAMYMLIVRHH